jgi:hypothetical protein
MTLLCDRFYVGDMCTFLGLVKVLKADPEFRIRFDFERECVELESMMMAGVVGIGVRLIKGSGSVFVPSPTSRSDQCTLKVDSQSFLTALAKLNAVSYAYLSLRPDDDAAICIDIYDTTGQCMGTGTVTTLTMDDSGLEFLVTGPQDPSYPYEIIVTNTGAKWCTYIQAAAMETTVRYDHLKHLLIWSTSSVQSNVSLYLAVPPQNSADVQLCLFPSVVGILRTVFQVTQKHATTVSLHEDLPVRIVAELDAHGSFLRVYAGTKDDV